jgi:enterochelin esterase family protein
MQRGQIAIATIDSAILRDNALGDPARRDIAVYLPPDYDANGGAYPTVYILVGFNSRGSMLLNEAPWDENIAQRMDRLIHSGTIQPMIVVMPDCLTRYGGSQYINSSATGRYEDHLIQEVVPFVDAAYRTKADRNCRAVVGKSSGGYGALMLAMRHPSIFGMTASHSGDMYFELCYKPAFITFVREMERERHGGGLAAYLRDLRTIRPRDAAYSAVLNTIAMASCYSPSPTSPHGFDLPFDLATAELIEEVWQRWLAWDPVHLVSQHAAALQSMNLVYLDAGRRDEFHLQYGARIFCSKLKQHDIRFVHEEFDDGHLNIPYRYDVSLKAISDAVALCEQAAERRS